MGRATRRAREGDRGHGPCDGERVSRRWAAAAASPAVCARRDSAEVRAISSRATCRSISSSTRRPPTGRKHACRRRACAAAGARSRESFATSLIVSAIPRASIEGTQIPIELVRRYATRGAADVVYDPRRKQSRARAATNARRITASSSSASTRRSRSSRSSSQGRIRTVLAEALARGEARHSALKRHRAADRGDS